MPIQVSCNCGKTFAVKDEFAGRKAKCPGCGNVLTIPNGAVTAPPPVMASPPPRAAAPAPVDDYDDQGYPDDGGAPRAYAPVGGDIFAQVGLYDLTKILFFVGAGCMLLLLISVFLPWSKALGISVSGLSTGAMGIIIILLTLGTGGFMGAALGMKSRGLFKISVLVAAGWAVLCALWVLLNILNFKSATSSGGSGNPELDKFASKAMEAMGVGLAFGIWITLLASVAVAGTLGFVGLKMLTAKR